MHEIQCHNHYATGTGIIHDSAARVRPQGPIMFSRTASRQLKGAAALVATAGAILYFVYSAPPSPLVAWLSGSGIVDHRAARTPLSQIPSDQELLSDKASSNPIVAIGRPFADLKSMHNSSAAAASANQDAEAEESEEELEEAGEYHAPSMSLRSAHAQKRCIPVGGPNSTARVLGRKLERCLPEWRSPEGLLNENSNNLSSDEIYITIKTTHKNHQTRMLPILLTWLQTVQPEQVYNNNNILRSYAPI